VTARDDFRQALRALPGRGVGAWDTYLRHNSRLPGPRANLELLDAAVDEGDERRFRHWRDLDRGREDAPDELVVMCGVVGLGRIGADTFTRSRRLPPGVVVELRRYANDERWRVREAVAMALQRIGDASEHVLLDVAEKLAGGSAYERRAAVAGVCEPRFCRSEAGVSPRIAALLDTVTESFTAERDRRADGAVALRKALSYGWSVALAADPRVAVPHFDPWVARSASDPDVRRIVRENLGKARLHRTIPRAVERWQRALVT
jgi:hypothetical protein